MPIPPKTAPPKNCAACDGLLARKRYPSGVLEDYTQFTKRKYCNQSCMAKGMAGVIKVANPKSSRRQSARRAKERCEACSRAGRLHVHHQDHNPENNRPENLVTLCGSCHKRRHSPNFSSTGERLACSHCHRPAKTQRLCGLHYQRKKKNGDPCLTRVRGRGPNDQVLKQVESCTSACIHS